VQVTLTIPDSLAAQFAAEGKEPSRAALEALAVEGYRAEHLSESEIRQMLGFETRMEVHAFLKDRGVYLHYSIADLEQDRQTSLRHRVAQDEAVRQQ
jgi:hypothetical protein